MLGHVGVARHKLPPAVQFFMRKLLQALALALTLALTLLVHLGASAQQAAPPVKKVAILSLIGDQLSVDNYRERVGSSLDVNDRTVMPVNDPVFDHAALLAAAEAASKLVPGASFLPLSVPKAGSALDPNLLLQGKSKLIASPVVDALHQQGFDHLLTVTKNSARANMKFSNKDTGSGYLQGLGFYIDNFFYTRNGNTGSFARGYIAPYAYLKLTLIRLGDGAIVGEEILTVTKIRSATGNKEGLGAWDAIDPAEKAEMLKSLINTGISAAVPQLLQGK